MDTVTSTKTRTSTKIGVAVAAIALFGLAAYGFGFGYKTPVKNAAPINTAGTKTSTTTNTPVYQKPSSGTNTNTVTNVTPGNVYNNTTSTP